MSALVCPGSRAGRAGAGALALLASVLPAIGADFAPDPSVLGRPLAIAADGRVPVPLVRAAAPPSAPATNDTLELRLLPFRDPLTGETLPVTLSLPGLANTPVPVRRVETTNGPCLVQFAPAPGTLTGTVTLRRRDRALTVTWPVVTVAEARELGVLRGFEEIEVWSTVVALGLALVSGLAARFFNVPTFGSSTDYLTLFLWGVGVDQAKNAWQIFSTYSSPTPPPRS